MIALQRIVRRKHIPFKHAGLAHFVYLGVFSVAGALMTMNMLRHSALSCFVQIVGSNSRNARRNKIAGLVLPSLFLVNLAAASDFMARDRYLFMPLVPFYDSDVHNWFFRILWRKYGAAI